MEGGRNRERESLVFCANNLFHRCLKVQELDEKQEQLNIKETSESQEKMKELDKVKALLLAKDSALQRMESDRLQLTKQVEESQEEVKILIKERDELRRTREALHVEIEQQKENIKEIGAKVSLSANLEETKKNRTKMIVMSLLSFINFFVMIKWN